MPQSSYHQTNLDPTLRPVLDTLLNHVRAAPAERFVGLYLHGSIATGDFTPGRSDVDFLVVMEEKLSPRLLPVLADRHAQIAASGLPYASKLEGSYIPRAALRRYDPADAEHPALRVDGSFDIDRHDSSWIIQRWVLREHGVVLAGPPIRDLIDPVATDELRGAAVGVLCEWWGPQLADTQLLAEPEYQAYAVLTMCRTLYTLEHGSVVTKTVAARWAQDKLPERAGLIADALAWRDGTPPVLLDEVLDFIHHTLARAAMG